MTSEPVPIVIPREDVNDDSVVVTKWLIAEGGPVQEGEPIAEVETSKVNLEILAPASGFLRRVHREGDEVDIGHILGYVCSVADAEVSAGARFTESNEAAATKLDRRITQSNSASVARAEARTSVPPQGGSTRISQRALELIDDLGLDASQFMGKGVVRSQDVLKFAREVTLSKSRTSSDGGAPRLGPVPAVGVKVRTETISHGKRLEAKHLWSAYRNTLPSSVTVGCRSANLHVVAQQETGIRANLAAVVIFEVARLLRSYPIFNAYYADECAHYYEDINIGFAIDAGHGLKVPVILQADRKSINQIASEMQDLLVRYLNDDLSPACLNGGTFTVTDLSGEGVHLFQPLINSGQSAILAVCSGSEAYRGDESLFHLVLGFDHQLSEGRQAARFLNELRTRLEGEGGEPKAKEDRPSLSELGAVEPRNPTEEMLAKIWSELFGLETVGIHDNFLEMGGHSLLATRLISRMRDVFGLDLPLRSLFETPTIAGLAATIGSSKRTSAGESIALPAAVPDLDHRYLPFPLTDVQQAYWIGRSNSFELGGVACHIYSEIEFPNFEETRFELAVQRLVERHEMLRAIVLSDGTQQILKEVPPYKLKVLDLRKRDPEIVQARLQSVRDRMSHQVLESDQWPLFDIEACVLDDGRAQLHISLDLLILDARSIQILAREFSRLYENPAATLTPLEFSFRDYVQAEIAFQKSSAYRQAEAYWKARLKSLPAAPQLPLSKSPTLVKKPRFARRSAKLSPKAWSSLKERARHGGLTPAGILLAAFAEVLSVWSKSPEFTLNLTLFNRIPFHSQVNEVVGDFTSLTMLSVENPREDTFGVRARRIQEQLWTDLDHRYFSGIRVLRELSRGQHEAQRTTMPVVFTSFLNLDRTAQGRANDLGNITHGITQTPQVWLDNLVREEHEALLCNWDAVEELFPEGVLDEMFGSYVSLLMELAESESAWQRRFRESAENLIPRSHLQLFREVNATEEKCSVTLLHNLFLREAAKHPKQIAVAGLHYELNYAQVHKHACTIEQALLKRNVEPNRLVAVTMERGWEQVAAVLGVHFAGCAYLPIDPDLPPDRQRYIVEHGLVGIVLTQAAVKDKVAVPQGVEIVVVDSLQVPDDASMEPRLRQKPEDLAYVIYTSGSTGLPKGVMIDHRGAANTVLDINRRFGIERNDRVLALSRLSFDLSVYDIFGLLAAGATIVMPNADRVQDVEHWAELVRTHGVTVWNSVPALMQLLVDHCRLDRTAGDLPLRLIMMSGDWIPVTLPGQIRQLAPAAKIVSLGGATEASIWSILYPISELGSEWKSIPYGKPMTNQSFHVLNEALGPCPVMVPGHLYIGGMGVAKGYWRDAKKTQHSFIHHPQTGERLYRTGDLGRYLRDGNIEFLGRDDFQVKVRGHRIELGEIEVQLQQHRAVESCVVVVRQDRPGEKLLVAYVVLKSGMHLEASDIRDHLRSKLPEYMVPAAIVFLDKLPLSANGKVDRKILPEPVNRQPESTAVSSSAHDLLELQLTRAWERILDVRPVRSTDDFFDLGGHSLLALRLFAEVRKLTGRNYTLSTLLLAPTVEKLAALLRKDGWSPSLSSLVPMQTIGNKPPFFCVHGAGGNVVMFRDLALRLGSDYPFYGLQSQGLDGSGNYLRTVEEMAALYLMEIRQIQPDGPYFLGGFCLGGLVAYEIAQLLRNQGESVAMVVMMDTYNFNGLPPRLSFREEFTHVREKIEFHSFNVLRLGLAEQLNYLRRKIRGVYEREAERLLVRVSNLAKMTPLGKGRRKFEIFLEHLNEEAGFSYVPKPYSGKVTIFRPRKNYSHLKDPQMGWGPVLRDGLDIVELPVNPGGLFVEPYVRVLAEKLRTCIDRALENTPPFQHGPQADQESSESCFGVPSTEKECHVFVRS